MASSLSQLTGGGVRAAPGGGGGSFLDGAMATVYTGEVGLILSGIAVVFCLYVMVSGRGATSRGAARRAPELQRRRKLDVAKLRRARMSSPDPDLDHFS
ncbi:hypothetical protein [uncultured Albimonas sp.]|uniref:hypothetical protein n=1 Tax=uncultured Albimonas sp. TaxID=1331701 RepID=UPI0030EE2FED|tara:strand:- start:946 stop:1242 length:297 start_codon:yes stop_codon:yes gene_type:complete